MTIHADQETHTADNNDTPAPSNDVGDGRPVAETSTMSAERQENQEAENSNMSPLNEEDDDVTVILLDAQTTDDPQSYSGISFDWIQQQGPEMEERRRIVLLRELKRLQRASFLHFVVLCSVPVILLIILIATVIADSEDCESDATFCELEPRTFVNAFTTRCVCNPLQVSRDDSSP